VIRRATPADAEVVARINRESRAEAMPWLPDLHTPEEDVAWFRNTLAGEAWIFEEDGEPVGYAAMKDGELHDLYVAPGAQRRGVGGALFAQVQAAHPDGFRFWAFRDNTRARNRPAVEHLRELGYVRCVGADDPDPQIRPSGNRRQYCNPNRISKSHDDRHCTLRTSPRA